MAKQKGRPAVEGEKLKLFGVYLNTAEVEFIKAEAHRMGGIKHSQVVRAWIRERMNGRRRGAA